MGFRASHSAIRGRLMEASAGRIISLVGRLLAFGSRLLAGSFSVRFRPDSSESNWPRENKFLGQLDAFQC